MKHSTYQLNIIGEIKRLRRSHGRQIDDLLRTGRYENNRLWKKHSKLIDLYWRSAGMWSLSARC